MIEELRQIIVGNTENTFILIGSLMILTIWVTVIYGFLSAIFKEALKRAITKILCKLFKPEKSNKVTIADAAVRIIYFSGIVVIVHMIFRGLSIMVLSIIETGKAADPDSAWDFACIMAAIMAIIIFIIIIIFIATKIIIKICAIEIAHCPIEEEQKEPEEA